MTILIQAAEYPIKSVTVFKSFKAEVVRTFSLSLQKGQNKVDISGLSSTIDTQSVRISGLGDARLLDIVTTVKRAFGEDISPTSTSEVIRKLQQRITALESALLARQQGSALLAKYGESLTAEHVSPEQMDEFLSTFIDREKERIDETMDTKNEILELQRQMIAEREKASSKKGNANGHVDAVLFSDSDARIEMTLTYIVSDASWRPTYELHATTESGRPSSSVKLHYRAYVNQSTGEDWSNTSLTLSTVSSDTVVTQIPHLRSVTLHQPSGGLRRRKGKQTHVGPVIFVSNNAGPGNQKTSLFGQSQATTQQQLQPSLPFGPSTTLPPFGQPSAFAVPPPFGRPSFGGFGAAASTNTLVGTAASSGGFGSAPIAPASNTGAFGSTAAAGSGLFGAPNPTTSAAVPASACPPDEEEEFEEINDESGSDPITIVTETPMAISFSVHGESNIPSDGVDHQVCVAVLPFSAKISYVAIPRMDPRVFLQCEVRNSSEYRLLPGPVTVILDNSYVSKTSINDVNTGDDFECTLGDDAAAKVTYERTSKTVKSDGGTFSEVTNTTTYTSKISIHNKHPFAINDLIVRDVIPTCEDKRLKIVLRKPKGLADAKDGAWVDMPEDGLRVGWEKLVDGVGGEKQGRFEWRWRVDTGAKVNLFAEWEVKAPGELAWVEIF